MQLIKLYKPFVGTEPKFVDSLPEGSQDIAHTFWASLNHSCIYFLLFMVFMTTLICISYFTVYNERPGRHYKTTHWLLFFVGAVVVVYFGTGLLGHLLTNPTVTGAKSLIWDIALGNFVYSLVGFLLLSIIWWCFLPTNAYRPFVNR